MIRQAYWFQAFGRETGWQWWGVYGRTNCLPLLAVGWELKLFPLTMN